MAKPNKKLMVLGILGIAAAGAFTAASAASLSVNASGNLQAGVDDLANCQTSVLEVATQDPTWNVDQFTVAGINLGSVDAACATHNAKVSVLDENGAELTTGNIVLTSATSQGITLSSAVNAEDVAKLAVVIY